MDGTAVSAPAAPAAPPEDFESLLAPVVERAYGTALRLTGEAADAEDLVQEAALRAFQAFHQYRQGTNFRAWFFRILLNCFYASRRKKRPETSLEALEEAPPLYLYSRTAEAGLHAPGRDPAREVLDRIAGEDAARAVASLPEEFRVVATLYFMDDFSYQEIAGVLDVPVGTVRSRLHRGRKLLQKALWEVATDAGLVAARSEDA
ncbi:MAG TPA: sigma-70 family RNA polymerase sigma factor [Longimicrobium sp.]|nr:sigma-70 family RNA polymerase sigma factor [Longimicrobium sp.]